MIKTKEFPFTKEQYFKILLKNSLRRSMWALAFLIVILIYAVTTGVSKTLMLLATLPIIYFGYLAVRCWIHANSKVNKLFFKERVFEIDDQSITISFKEGAATVIEINDIARVVKNKQYYLLFLSKRQFVYVPLSAFRTPGDSHRFDGILKARKRRK